MKKARASHEPPEAVKKWGWKYHHTGVPTPVKKTGEIYLPQYKFFVSGYESSPFGIEWMRFENDSPLCDIIKTVPHVAFEVEDIDREIEIHNLRVISEPGQPSEGVRAAMIEHNGAPVELIEFQKNKKK